MFTLKYISKYRMPQRLQEHQVYAMDMCSAVNMDILTTRVEVITVR